MKGFLPQAEGPPTPGPADEMFRLLWDRRERPTLIRFHDGEELVVRQGSGGRDIGDLWGHVTFQLEPPPADGSWIFSRASEVVCLIEPETGAVLYEQTPAPGEF